MAAKQKGNGRARNELPAASRQLGQGRPRRAGFLLDQRLRPILICAAAMLLLFTVFRAALVVIHVNDIEELSPAQLARCFFVGLRYDAIPMGYALLPLVLLLSWASRAGFQRKGFRKAVAIYGTVLVSTTVVVEGVGAAFFMRFAKRLDWIALSYPQHVREIGGYIWYNYPVLLVVPAMVVLVYVIYRLLYGMFWRGPDVCGRGWRRGALAGGMVVACLLACRGGWGPYPLRFGPAFFTRNNLIDQLTMNNFFTLLTAEQYPYPPSSDAQELTAWMLHQDRDKPLGSKSNRLWRLTQTGRPLQSYNVVVILMEGMSGQPVGAMGYSPSQTPRLDALCREGLFFDRLYAAGARTSRAMIAVLCGHPDLDGVSVLKQEQAQGKFLSLPSIFQHRGYHTMFIYGGDPDFDNMRQFLLKDGVDEILGEKDMKAEKFAGTWGVTDEAVLRRTHERLVQMGDQPFFAAILTLSNHEAYRIPRDRVEMLPGEDEDTLRLNAYRYADWALGLYFDLARQADYFHRTIFVLVADHGHHMDKSRIIDVPGYRVPCLFYAPGIVPSRKLSTVGSQTDIPPTLLALLGGSYEHCFMGRNLLDVPAGEGFALLHSGALAFVRNDLAVVLPPDMPKAMLFQTGPFTMENMPDGPANEHRRRQLQEQMLAYYSAAQKLFSTESYRLPPDLPTPQSAREPAPRPADSRPAEAAAPQGP